MSVAPEIIQKINVFAVARGVDTAARLGSHVVGRGVMYGAMRGAVRGAAAGAYQGFREGARFRTAARAARRFRTGVGRGYRDQRWLQRVGTGSSLANAPRHIPRAVELHARYARLLATRTSRAGRAGYAVGTHARLAETGLRDASRTLVRAFNRRGRRIAAHWRNNR